MAGRPLWTGIGNEHPIYGVAWQCCNVVVRLMFGPLTCLQPLIFRFLEHVIVSKDGTFEIHMSL